MPILFAVTLFVSALLLFMVQPMIGRMILPLLGGSPAAWNTCMVFFQFVLLLGYLYAHKLTAKLSIKQQILIHCGVLAAALGTFALAALLSERQSPIAIVKSLAPQDTAYPMFGVMALLLVAIGVPFFAVSTSAPLLQRWFASTGHSSAKDPYFLYAASNAGSLLSLLLYPMATEPNLTLKGQAWLFAGGFAVLAAMIFACSTFIPKQSTAANPAALAPAEPPARIRVIKWILLAFVPSSLMLGVTFYMTTDIASVPLLWVIPLALYLLTFIIAFMRTPSWMRIVLGNVAPVVTLLLIFVIITQQPLPSTFWLIGLHLAAFFLLALMCHSELAADRPPPQYLTNFFLWISVGGMLGGVFNALLAPLVFPLPWEYTIALAVGCMMVPKLNPDDPGRTQREYERTFIYDLFIPLGFLTAVLVMTACSDLSTFIDGTDWIAQHVFMGRIDGGKIRDAFHWALPLIACFFFIERPVRFGCCVAAVLFVGEFRRANMEFHTERSFFGILKVQRYPSDLSQPIAYRALVHGTTLHGRQAFDPWPLRDDLKDPIRALVGPWAVDTFNWQDEPLTYYHRSGPVGHLFSITRQRHKHANVAMVGLGTGSVSCYADKDLDLTYYEIDPTVKKLVADREKDPYFTFVSDARARGAKIDFILGDARLKLDENQNARYDLLLIDAFSSDSIPVHLLTKEALELYLNRLSSTGLLALHISNKYLKLDLVVASLVKDLNRPENPLVALEFSDSWIDDIDSRQAQYAPPGKTQSSWVVLTRNPKLVEALKGDRYTTQYTYRYVPSRFDTQRNEEIPDIPPINRWQPMNPNDLVKPWTDDYADVLLVMMLKEVQQTRKLFGLPTLDDLTK